jgi:hypothetical protein
MNLKNQNEFSNWTNFQKIRTNFKWPLFGETWGLDIHSGYKCKIEKWGASRNTKNSGLRRISLQDGSLTHPPVVVVTEGTEFLNLKICASVMFKTHFSASLC